jgi:HEAT repeat protein
MAHLQKYKTGQSLSRAAEALGEIGDRRAMPLLLEKMTCPYVVLREYAAMAYGKLANDKDLEGLLALASQGKMDIREAQLAFEEQFQSDFKIDTKLPVQQLVESVRQQYQKLKEEPATTRTPEKTRLEREIEDKAEDQ